MSNAPHTSAASPILHTARQRQGKTFNVGPYEVHGLIEKSKTGHIFRARNEQLNQTVALKVLPLEDDASGKTWSVDGATKLTKHIETASQIVHDNIVRPYHLGEQNNVHYVAMEYVDGVSLADVLAGEGVLDPRTACEITLQIAYGLRHIHDSGMIHGQIRPENVVLTDDGTIKITDFGFTELQNIESSEAANSRRYLSPEQLAIRDEIIDARSDVFSLGCVLFELLFGAPAFHDDARDVEPAALKSNTPVISPMLLATVSGMIATDPAKRVQTCNDVVQAMHNWALGEHMSDLVARYLVDENKKLDHFENIELSDEPATGEDVATAFATLSTQLVQNTPAVRPNADLPKSRPEVPCTRLLWASAVFVPLAIGMLAFIATRPKQAIESAAPGAFTENLATTQTASALVPHGSISPAATSVTPGDGSSAGVHDAMHQPQVVSKPRARASTYHETITDHLEIFHGLPTGDWLLRPNETTSINDAVHYGHMVLPARVANMEFKRAVRLVVEDRGGAAWDAGYFVPNVSGLSQGDRLLLVVWLRADSVCGERGRTGELRIFCEEESTDSKDFYLPLNPTDRWQRFLIPFESRSDQPRRIGFHLACEKQVIEYGGLAVINYGKSVPFVDLPHELNQN